MEDYIVYKHTSPDGKVYVGITRQNVSRRWRGGKGYIHNEHFTRAIVKYGWDNFRHEILFDSLEKSEAEQKEIELIQAYKSYDKQFGYNIELGGNSVGKKPIETNKRFGCHLTDETKQKISASRLGQYKGANNPRAKRVLCISTGEIFNCIKDASIKYGIQICNISGVCKGRLKSAGGYEWRYCED